MSAADSSGVCHLLPSADPLSGLHAYASNLSGDAGQLISPNPQLHLPPRCRTLVLHYSGYGYAANGAPDALVRQCTAWRAADRRHRLLVVFHELFARQPPWRKGFWWSPRQRQVIRRLARASDNCLSTLERHSAWLRRQGFPPVATLAVPSNVGEHAEPLAWHQRRRRLLVFGGVAQRQRAYAALRRCLSALDALAIEAIDDVGPGLPSLPHTALPLRRHGPLPAAAVADLIGSTAVGAVAYPFSFLAKSGIFAALCAHGCTPLVLQAGSCRRPADGLQAGDAFLTPQILAEWSHPAAAEQAAAQIAETAWHWYQPHRLAEQRRLFQGWLSQAGSAAI